MTANRIPGGLTDNSIEFFTMTVCGIQTPMVINSGRLIEFEQTPPLVLDVVKNEMLRYPVIKATLDAIYGNDEMLKLAKFVMCRYGALNNEPDITDKHQISMPEYVPCDQRGSCPYEGVLCCTIMVKNGVYLSKSETQVFKLVKLPDKNIASKLYLSVETVKTHWQNIRRKTGLNNKIEIAIWATKKGII